MSELRSLGEIVARMRAAGKPIPKAWGHVKPIQGDDLSTRLDVVHFTRGQVDEQLVELGKEITATRRDVSVRHQLPLDKVGPEIDRVLAGLYERRRQLKRLRKSARKAKKPKPKFALVRRTPAARVRVTRTVDYVYNESDNERLSAFYSTSEWKMARYEALRLHGGRCQCCGASPADGKTINVDHIKPLRVFWDLRLDITNLQVLCGDCNEGKGARHADDWRP